MTRGLNLRELLQPGTGRYVLDAMSLSIASSVAREGWNERRAERFLMPSKDMSGSCKFGSLFLRALFGGEIRGNSDHQYVIREGRILDLSAKARDVAQLDDPYGHAADWFNDPDLRDSLESCLPRVVTWITRFETELSRLKDCTMTYEEQRKSLEAQLVVLKVRLKRVGLEGVLVTMERDGSGEIGITEISSPTVSKADLEAALSAETPIFPGICDFGCELPFVDIGVTPNVGSCAKRVAFNTARLALHLSENDDPGQIQVSLFDGLGKVSIDGDAVRLKEVDESDDIDTPSL